MLTNRKENCVEHVNVSNQTFENFIVSETNIQAFNACVEFAKGSNAFPNPLVLCGPSPCGKSHLLNAIATYIQNNEPSVKVSVVRFDDFISLYVECLHKKDLSAFEERYLTADALLIDNAQFLAGLSGTQECFAEIFYEMCLSGKRVALVSDRPSRYYRPLYVNLHHRLDSFKIVDIDSPDYAIRKQYLLKVIAEHPDVLTENMIRYIAMSKRISFSSMPGMFRKICLFEEMTGNPLTTRSIIEIIKSYEK